MIIVISQCDKFVYPGSRVTHLFRFGFISLDVINALSHDNGEYVCRISSATGVAESRSVVSISRKYIFELTSWMLSHGITTVQLHWKMFVQLG